MAGKIKPNEANLNNENNIDDYIINNIIGEGNFGKVMLGTHIITGEKVLSIS